VVTLAGGRVMVLEDEGVSLVIWLVTLIGALSLPRATSTYMESPEEPMRAATVADRELFFARPSWWVLKGQSLATFRPALCQGVVGTHRQVSPAARQFYKRLSISLRVGQSI
jgi:hypothetical protein